MFGKIDKRIIFIDELQEIPNLMAQKNILTLLEKNWDNTYFILGTMDKSKMDGAIIRRCIQYNLNLSYKNINLLSKIYTSCQLSFYSSGCNHDFESRPGHYALQSWIIH